ncbi:MAG TPA: hypothetical protein VHF27_10340 [Acidimicrobiales bacterium]|nr:hypothetical protein [Acidimicrobiales bacterium]
MEYRALGGTGVQVSHLDHVDAPVPPGTDVNPGDAGWTSPARATQARRR